jgi:hypothetical protein
MCLAPSPVPGALGYCYLPALFTSMHRQAKIMGMIMCAPHLHVLRMKLCYALTATCMGQLSFVVVSIILSIKCMGDIFLPHSFFDHHLHFKLLQALRLGSLVNW